MAAALLFFLLLRPIAMRHRKRVPAIRTGAAALIGQHALVLERIANNEGVGTVRIGGEVWTARAYDEEEVIPAGEHVEVVEIRGATALVMTISEEPFAGWIDRSCSARGRRARACGEDDQGDPAGARRGARAARPLPPHAGARSDHLITPFIDRMRPLIDLREQVVNFSPQPVITQDNVVVNIETVLYFTITDARAATYEIASPLQAIEQLTVTTLRNVIGGLTLEQTLTSREGVNTELRAVLDEATGKWGIRINRVEIKSVDPPADIKAAMEKQMRAERDRRAAILTAEGTKQAAILTAEGEQQAAVLTAEGARQAAILRAEGEAKAIATVFAAIHAGKPDQKLLSYQYLQMLPQLAQGEANKVFVIPSEFTQAFAGIGDSLSRALPAKPAKPEEE